MSTQIIASIITGCCTLTGVAATVIVTTWNQTRVLKAHMSDVLQGQGGVQLTVPTEASDADR